MSNRGGQYRRDMMEALSLAKLAWWTAAEYETMMYATELAEYKLTHPMPNLRSFMVDYKASRIEAQHAAGLELAYLEALDRDMIAVDADELQEAIEDAGELEALNTPAPVVEVLEAPAATVRTAPRTLALVSAAELEAIAGGALTTREYVIFPLTLKGKPGRIPVGTGIVREGEDEGDRASITGGERGGLTNGAIGGDRSGSTSPPWTSGRTWRTRRGRELVTVRAGGSRYAGR